LALTHQRATNRTIANAVTLRYFEPSKCTTELQGSFNKFCLMADPLQPQIAFEAIMGQNETKRKQNEAKKPQD
jgi:hypothetical protein